MVSSSFDQTPDVFDDNAFRGLNGALGLSREKGELLVPSAAELKTQGLALVAVLAARADGQGSSSEIEAAAQKFQELISGTVSPLIEGIAWRHTPEVSPESLGDYVIALRQIRDNLSPYGPKDLEYLRSGVSTMLKALQAAMGPAGRYAASSATPPPEQLG